MIPKCDFKILSNNLCHFTSASFVQPVQSYTSYHVSVELNLMKIYLLYSIENVRINLILLSCVNCIIVQV